MKSHFAVILTCAVRHQPSHDGPEPRGPAAWLDAVRIPDFGATLLAHAPAARGKAPVLPAKQILVDLIQDRVVLHELPGKGDFALDHPGEVPEGESPGMLTWRPVPRDVVKVVVDGGAGELRVVAYDCLEVSFCG